ncbi:MAG: OmpA family protein, partial [Bacteroidales bacterium]|nr:OmpA family protein [Bacteroidales bacterium]
VLTDILAVNPDFRLVLVGHTCDLGSKEINVRVGQKRADAVKHLLVKGGISEAKMKTITKAYDEPLVPNTSGVNRVKNRRVELKFVKEGK